MAADGSNVVTGVEKRSFIQGCDPSLLGTHDTVLILIFPILSLDPYIACEILFPDSFCSQTHTESLHALPTLADFDRFLPAHLLNTIQSFKLKTEESSPFNKQEISKTKGRNVNINYGKTKNTSQEAKQKTNQRKLDQKNILLLEICCNKQNKM